MYHHNEFYFPTVCDYLGERLAYFFGITSPKYGYALSEYNRLEKEVNVHESWLNQSIINNSLSKLFSLIQVDEFGKGLTYMIVFSRRLK